MSKLSKLRNNPVGFFRDALAKSIDGPPDEAAPAGKPAAKRPVAKKPVARKPAAKKPAARKLSALKSKTEKMKAQLALLKTMALEGEYESVRKAWRYAEGESYAKGEFVQFLGVQAEAEFASADHDTLMATTETMIADYNSTLAYFYQAQSYFVRGLYDEALNALNNLFYKRPAHADGVYLLCEIAERTGETETAWQALEDLAKVSKRNKTWHMMGNLVNSNTDLMRLLKNWQAWSGSVGPAYHQDVSEFVALGALRAGNATLARRIWRDSLMAASKKAGGFSSMKNRKPSYSGKRAEAALADLNKAFKEADIEMFLVSGTLLGCVREDRLLGHDKDIDVGIWSKVPEEDVLKLATESGMFFMLKSRSKEIIRLRHVNGIAIDVFYHYKKRSDTWHGGVKMVWHNTPFKLVEREFLGETHLIPEDYDLYLTENYGDWRTPMIAFDSAFDTPNGEILDKDEMAIHTFKGLMASCIDEEWQSAVFYLDKLAEYGEETFAETFEQRLKNMKINAVNDIRNANQYPKLVTSTENENTKQKR